MFGVPDQLLVTLSGNAISAIVILVGGTFILLQNTRGRANILFFLQTTSVALYHAVFILGSLQTEYYAAYFWWFLNICDVLIAMFTVHFVFVVIKKERVWAWFISLTYLTGAAIFFYAWFDQAAFLPTVLPKLYFPYYLEPGWLYHVMLAHFLIAPAVAFVNVLVAYWHSSGVERQRYEYFVLMLLLGYCIGCLNFALVYDIAVDPIFGMFIGLYLVPIGYGIFTTNLLDIRLVVRRAFYYAFLVGAVSALLTAVILLNDFLIQAVPWLQFWTLPLVVSLVAVGLARLVWGQTKDADRLKYEFITIAAHKLRTPLTRIRWEIPPLLAKVGDNTEVKEGLVRIDVANNRLIELTNILMEAAHTEDTAYGYKKDPVDLSVAIKNAVGRFESQIKEKNLSLVTQIDPGVGKPVGDSGRLGSVIDVLVENAVIYNKDGGSVHIALTREGAQVKFSVSDTGIGVSREDANRIFSSFYRSEAAKRADTEGVGIGLSVAKNIIEKHGGKIGVESEGDGKGSTFWFTLPV